MKDKKVKYFYLPLNRKVLLCLILSVILVSYGVMEFDKQSPQQAVFSQQPKAYYRGPTEKQEISLAINVAWGTEYIPQLLEILEKKDVHATFFLVGNWVEKFPDLTATIKEAGHILGNHGYRHRHPKQLAKEELIELIKKNEDLIRKKANYKTNLFAPPYGEVDSRVVKIADEIGYKTIMWTVDTIDWQRPDPEVINQRVSNKVVNGAIILMHPTKPTVDALPKMIDELKQDGYQIVPIPELLAAK